MTLFNIITRFAIIAGFLAYVSFGDEGLTERQKKTLDEFKKLVLSKLPENYTKDDMQLLRFLTAKKFNINKAEKLILRDVQWRTDNKIDTIHLEDFKDVESQGYKMYLESFDLEGKPILTANIGEWDLRRATSPKTFSRLKRYIDRNFELATRKVVELQTSGKNITQWDFIINGDTKNNQQKRCMSCVPLYVHVINSYEQHYPGYVDKLVMFNTAKVFEDALKVMRGILSPSTSKALMVFDNNRTVWEPELLKIADPSELPPEYGGTKIYSSS